VRGSRNRGAVDGEGQVVVGFVVDDKDFRCVAIEFEEDVLHLGLYIREVVADGGVGNVCDGFGGNVKLCVVGVAVKVETVVAYDVANGEQVEWLMVSKAALRSGRMSMLREWRMEWLMLSKGALRSSRMSMLREWRMEWLMLSKGALRSSRMSMLREC